MVRNLRDLVPRQIFNFLIVKCLKQLEFESFQFTSDVKKLKEWLNEVIFVFNIALRSKEQKIRMYEGN